MSKINIRNSAKETTKCAPEVEEVLDFTKRLKNVSVRYLNSQAPTTKDANNWIVLPLYQHGQNTPIDNDGKTSVLLANVPTLHAILKGWEKRIKEDKAALAIKKTADNQRKPNTEKNQKASGDKLERREVEKRRKEEEKTAVENCLRIADFSSTPAKKSKMEQF